MQFDDWHANIIGIDNCQLTLVPLVLRVYLTRSFISPDGAGQKTEGGAWQIKS